MCSLQGNGLCDRRTRPCRKVAVLGTGFIPSENMTCHVEELRVRAENCRGTASPIEENQIAPL